VTSWSGTTSRTYRNLYSAISTPRSGYGYSHRRPPPARTKSLNTTLDSLQSSIEKLTATTVVADAVSEVVDGSTLILRGDLGDVATTGEVEAILRESSRREGRRGGDLGAGGGIR
jgi:hypothetical protein